MIQDNAMEVRQSGQRVIEQQCVEAIHNCRLWCVYGVFWCFAQLPWREESYGDGESDLECEERMEEENTKVGEWGCTARTRT